MRIFLPFVFILSCITVSAVSQEDISLFDSLYNQKNVKISLTYPFDSLYSTNQEEIDALISIETAQGFLMKDVKMTLNLRGKFRRMKCSMPPLLLNFKKSTLRDLHMSPIDEIKLVTHCLPNQEGQENLEEERMCYQLYEVVTPNSYRTIWLNVIYHDALHPDDSIISTGFLLEPDKVISLRLGLSERKLFNISEDSLQFETYSLAVAFNFMIGNRDWSIIMSRNAKLFFNNNLNKYIVIPYDFDYSNIVGASYRRETRPASMLDQYDRLYEGEYFKNRAGDILTSFTALKPILLDRVMSAYNPMDVSDRKKIYKYLETWFNYVEKAKPGELKYGMMCPYKGGL
jgi:hypothetical protein